MALVSGTFPELRKSPVSLTYAGGVNTDGNIYDKRAGIYMWESTSYNKYIARRFFFNGSNYIAWGSTMTKSLGYTLRCVQK